MLEPGVDLVVIGAFMDDLVEGYVLAQGQVGFIEIGLDLLLPIRFRLVLLLEQIKGAGAEEIIRPAE